jgi:LmbE family N-acetylglucosaminyl deacetylase
MPDAESVKKHPLNIAGPLLVVMAHADDAEVRAGGVVSLLTRRERDVYYAICTDGSKGSQDRHDSAESIAARRQAEQLAAAAKLGVRQVYFLGCVDGEISNPAALQRDLVCLLRTLRPEVVITHDAWAPYQLHVDHRITGMATCDAVMAARSPRFYPEQVAAGLEPHTVKQLWLAASLQPNIFVNIGEVISQKLEALACHVSQGGHTSSIQQRVRNRDHEAGRVVNAPFAEPFRRLMLSEN